MQSKGMGVASPQLEGGGGVPPGEGGGALLNKGFGVQALHWGWCISSTQRAGIVIDWERGCRRLGPLSSILPSLQTRNVWTRSACGIRAMMAWHVCFSEVDAGTGGRSFLRLPASLWRGHGIHSKAAVPKAKPCISPVMQPRHGPYPPFCLLPAAGTPTGSSRSCSSGTTWLKMPCWRLPVSRCLRSRRNRPLHSRRSMQGLLHSKGLPRAAALSVGYAD